MLPCVVTNQDEFEHMAKICVALQVIRTMKNLTEEAK